MDYRITFEEQTQFDHLVYVSNPRTLICSDKMRHSVVGIKISARCKMRANNFFQTNRMNENLRSFLLSTNDLNIKKKKKMKELKK